MKTIRLSAILIILSLTFSCSIQSKMNRQFKGEDKSVLDEYFGQKGTIVSLSPEKKFVVYTRTKILRSVPVNKGVTTLDPMISPSAKKKQKFIFYLNEDNKVSTCKYESEYQQ